MINLKCRLCGDEIAVPDQDTFKDFKAGTDSAYLLKSHNNRHTFKVLALLQNGKVRAFLDSLIFEGTPTSYDQKAWDARQKELMAAVVSIEGLS